MTKNNKKIKELRRPVKNRSLAGVAAALANYFEIDVVIFRLLFVLTGIFGGGGVIVSRAESGLSS